MLYFSFITLDSTDNHYLCRMKSIEHIRERNDALTKKYFEKLKALGKTAPYVSKVEIITEVISTSAPRFYCSIEEAHRNCSRILRGKPITRKTNKNAKMYHDITMRVHKYRQDTGINSLKAALIEIIYDEAPEFYIGVEYAIQIINKSYK